MPKQDKRNPADFITPLYMNRLRGRLLYVPPVGKKRRQILIVYGQNTSLEQMFPLANELSRYGGVTVPDLPGFGGMESFFKIHEKPSLDNFADYLAAFVKLRYKRRRVSILGIAFGFLVVTRMLQKYPELAAKTDVLVSIAGFGHHQDFVFTNHKRRLVRNGTKLLSMPILAGFARHMYRKPIIIGKLNPYENVDKKQKNSVWMQNDTRTFMSTLAAMMSLDLCGTRVDRPIYHIASDQNGIFSDDLVEQHLNVIFDRVNLAGTASSELLVPVSVRRALAKS